MQVSAEEPTGNQNLLAETSFHSTWPGWATVESDPIIFSRLVRALGVQGISVEEIYSLDSAALSTLLPIYGLVFLFRSQLEHEDDEQEPLAERGLEGSGKLWFANQVVSNACASLALLNIVFNVEDASIGDHLTSFKEFTKDLSPIMRGLALSNFDHLRRLHNTFARKLEMQESDLALMQSAKARKPKRQKKDDVSDHGDEDDAEEAYHFIGYIYKDGHVWELDGLKELPVRHGRATKENWTDIVRPVIQARMQSYAANEIRFNLLGLCKDPLAQLEQDLRAKESELAVADAATQPGLLMDLETIQAKLDFCQEKENNHKEYAERHRHDYGDFIKRMLAMLNDKGVLQQLLG